MRCAFCMYEQDEKVCALKGPISDEVHAKGCDSFVDKPWCVSASGGCCGMNGLPFASSQRPYSDSQESSEHEAQSALQ